MAESLKRRSRLLVAGDRESGRPSPEPAIQRQPTSFQRLSGSRRRPLSAEKLLYGVFLTPYSLAMLAFTLLALGFGVVMSLLNVDLLAPAPLAFAGLSQYLQALKDATFWSSLKLTLYFITVPVLLEVTLGLLLALLFQRSRLPTLLQALLLVPMFASPIVTGFLWLMFFTPHLGGIDGLLAVFHLPVVAWLDNGQTALIAVTVADVWEWTPFAFVFLLAAVRSLPAEPYEAALIDGANQWQTVRYITLPLLRTPLLTVTLLEIVNYLALLPLIYSMTGGGPGTATEPLDLYAFVQGFEYFNLSYAAALLVILMGVMLIPALALIAGLRRGMVKV
uniref:Sugar ABC transporter permease n=1 Tax=Thermogemmatispora argillosa TaxID=2045280 RepID=A0A455SX95_9CHLR|nr:sugar ABC transporter permease [Thermogemmatispora argillosa]